MLKRVLTIALMFVLVAVAVVVSLAILDVITPSELQTGVSRLAGVAFVLAAALGVFLALWRSLLPGKEGKG